MDYILAFLAILTPVVFIHELGHYFEREFLDNDENLGKHLDHGSSDGDHLAPYNFMSASSEYYGGENYVLISAEQAQILNDIIAGLNP